METPQAQEGKRFLARTAVVQSPCELDLLVFLHRHPRNLLTSELLAEFVGYPLKDIATALDTFIEAGILERTAQQSGHASRLFLLRLEGRQECGLRTLLETGSTYQGRQAILEALHRPEDLDEMLSATIKLLGADMGNVQLLEPGRRVLTVAAQRGFKKDFLEFFREVSTDDDSACGRALRAGTRIVIEDVETDEPYAPLRPVALAAGYRAVQTTPLMGCDGRPIGMLSTHFRSVHRPTEQDFTRLDLYLGHAADLIEGCRP